MSGTAADHRPVPAESDAPLLSSSVNRTHEADQERRQDGGSLSPQTRVLSATLGPYNSPNNQNPTHTPTFQPGHPRVTQNFHTAYPLNDHERSRSMLDPNAQLRVIHAWMSAMRQVASLRDIILTARMDIKRERTRCHQQEEFFQKLVDAFMALLNSAHEHGSYPQCRNDLDDLSRKMKSSGEDLKTLRQRSSGMEDGLSNQEYRLTKLEEEIYQQIDTEYRLNSTQPTASSSRTSNATEMQAKSSETEETPNPRDELYSRIGDLRILLDRLNDFEYELRQELDERDLLRATGQIDISNDTVFFEQTRNERAKLQKELEDAQADVERLKQVCVRKGIEFEDVQFHNPFYPDTEVDETYSTPSTQAEAATLPLPESPSGILSTFFSTRERVKNWLKDPSSSDTMITGTAERNPEENVRRESLSSRGWVHMPHSWPHGRHPSSAQSEGDGGAQFGMPQWKSGPPAGSERIAALLEESMTEPSGKDIRKSI